MQALSSKWLWTDIRSFFENLTLKNNVNEVTTIKTKCSIYEILFASHYTGGKIHLKHHMESHDKKQEFQPDIHQIILLQSCSTGSLNMLYYDAIKSRKVRFRYVVLKNLPFNIVEESDLENIFRSRFPSIS